MQADPIETDTPAAARAPEAPPDVPARCSGPAFPLPVKGLATLTVAALMVAAVRSSERLAAAHWGVSSVVFMVATFAVIGVCHYWIVFSTTSIDATSIRQTWAWNKEVALADIRDVKFIYVPRLAWLIAPRLVVRARGGALHTFHAADRQVLQRFAMLRFGQVFEN